MFERRIYGVYSVGWSRTRPIQVILYTEYIVLKKHAFVGESKDSVRVGDCPRPASQH